MSEVDTRTKVVRLLEVLQRDHPRVFIGLVNRFNPPGAGLDPMGRGTLEGLLDFFGNTVGKVTQFVNSQGFEKILTAARPWIASEVQKNQIGIQIRAVQAGVPVPSLTQVNRQIAEQQPGAPRPVAKAGFFDEVPGWVWMLLALGAGWMLLGGKR